VVRIHHITLSRVQLESIPEGERRLLVLAAHAANELNVLSKLFHFSVGGKTDVPILMQAGNAQSLVLGRVLAGKIYECWNLLKSAFFSTALSKSYVPQFDEEAKQALEGIKRYFGRENPIASVRNKHAFHYALDQIDAGYRAVIDGDPLEIYLAKANANTLFAFGDTIAGRAMLETIKPGDARGAFETLIDDTTKMVGLLNTVTGQIMAICIKAHLGSDLYSLGARVIEVEGAPESQEVSIPYFIEIVDEGDA
jgi:hypothetical protein